MTIPPTSSSFIPLLQRETIQITREYDNCQTSGDLAYLAVQEDLDRARVDFLNCGLEMRNLRLYGDQMEEFLTKKGKMITQLNLSYYPSIRIITLLKLCPNVTKVFLLFPKKEEKIIPKVVRVLDPPLGTSPFNLRNQPDDVLRVICEYLEPSELAKIVRMGKSFFKPTEEKKVKLMNSGTSFRTVAYNRTNLVKLIDRNFGQIKALNMAGAFVEDFLNQIVKCESLTSLSLKSCKIQLPFLAQLVQRISPVSLLKLDLGATRPKHHESCYHFCNYIGVKGIKILAESPLTNLTYLDISYNDLGDIGLAEFAKSNHFTQLKTLILTANDIGLAGIKALCDSTTLTSLTTIDLAQNPLDNNGFNCFFTSRLFSPIQTIILRGTGLEFYRNRTEPFTMTHLSSLNLSNNNLNSSFINSLVDSPINTTLVELNLHHTSIGHHHLAFGLPIFPLSQEAIAALSMPGSFPNLKTLNLSSNDLGDQGMIMLTSSTILGYLTNLDLSYNKISDKGALSLASSIDKSFNLTSLNLSGNEISSAGIAALMLGTKTKSVLSFSIYNNNVEITSPTYGRGIILENKNKETMN